MAQPAVTTTVPFPVKAEHDPAPPPPQPETTTTTPIEQEPQYTTTTATAADSLLSLPQPQTPSTPPPPLVSSFLNSITHLRDLSAALSAFHNCYNDLQAHLDSIDSALNSKLPLQKSNLGILPIVPLPQPTSSVQPPSPVTENEKGKEKLSESDLESLCALMSSRGLRKYILNNIGEPHKLREEVPKALKLSPNPAKLVLECSGRFFLQGRKAYTNGSPMIRARDASVLTLECFLLMGNEGGDDKVVKIEKAIREEAAEAAVSWKKRLVNEGGLANACEIDARGLLFFLGGFGIPEGFRNDDFRDLLRAGNVKEIAGVLRRSSVLATKITDIIGWMVKNKRVVDAVDIAYTIGFEDRFDPQTILSSFLRASKESPKTNKRTQHGSLAALNESQKKYLAALTSVVRCLEGHNIDPSKLLPGWQINTKIKGLEKDIAESDKIIREKAMQKRKADQIESSKLKNQEAKRSRYILIDSERDILDGVHGHINRSYASPSILHRAGASLLPEGVAGSVVGIGGDVHGAGLSGSVSASTTSILRPASYVGSHSGHIVRYDGHPYGSRGDSIPSEWHATQTYAAQPPSYGLASLYRRASPSLDSFPGLPSNSTVAVGHGGSSGSDLYQFADSIVEGESYHGGGSRASAATTHHQSYLY